MMRWSTALAFGAGLSLGVAAQAQANDDEAELRALGEHLSHDCVSCHKVEGESARAFNLSGMPKQEIIVRLADSQGGHGEGSQLLRWLIAELTDEERHALAVYFSSLPPQQ